MRKHCGEEDPAHMYADPAPSGPSTGTAFDNASLRPCSRWPRLFPGEGRGGLFPPGARGSQDHCQVWPQCPTIPAAGALKNEGLCPSPLAPGEPCSPA